MPAPISEKSTRAISEQERAPQPAGIVERLVRDDVDRKRFLKAVGGAGAASFGAFVLAACGSSSQIEQPLAQSLPPRLQRQPVPLPRQTHSV